MNITKFEQSGFILETISGFKLAIDIGSYTPVDKLAGVNPEVMIVSHLHGDHFSVEHIKKLNPRKLYLNQECLEILGEEVLNAELVVIKAGDILDIDGIKVEVFEVDHGPNVTTRPKENFGFLLELDGKRVYFCGDMFTPPSRSVGDLEIDTLLLPVGGFYTFGPQEALAFAKQFKTVGQIIPMHYEKVLETKGEFLKLAKEEGVNIENA